MKIKPIWQVLDSKTLEQWTGYSDNDFLYVVYWIDNSWETIRNTRDLIIQTTTWIQTWTKPITLVYIQWLTYN